MIASTAQLAAGVIPESLSLSLPGHFQPLQALNVHFHGTVGF